MKKNHYDCKGKNHPLYNTHHSKETKDKIGKSHSKKVICLTTMRVFDSIKEGAEFYKCDKSDLGKCCRNKIKYAGRYNGERLIWKFLKIIEL
jgi:hypothetical protein